MKKSKELLSAFEARMKLSGRAERRWFWAAFALLLLYVEFVIFAQNTALGYIGSPPLNVLQAAAAIPLCFLCLLAAGRWNISGEDRRAEDRENLLKRIVFSAVVWALTFSILFLCQRAYWPGGFNYDSIVQYEEAFTESYGNWHPVLHTWLFYRLPLQIFRKPAGIVLFQILWFSLAVTYLFYVLYTSGCPKTFLVCGWLYIAANPNTLFIMVIPGKDSALTIVSTVVFAQLVRIYLTKGAWLKKWDNLASFSVFAFLTLEMRHNAMLLVIPIFVLLIVFFRSALKRIMLSALTVFLAHLLLYGPVFTLMQVSLPGNRTVETTGLLMTVLSDVYVQDREALDEETRSFMDSLAPREVWESYHLGEFNSVKGKVDLSAVENAGRLTLLRYTVNSAAARPGLAWRAFCLLTRLVWEVDSGGGWDYPPSISENPFGIYYHGNELLRDGFHTYSALVSAHAARYLFCYTGGVILLLLFLAVGGLGGGNLSRSLLVLAPMAYNFGTMLLLMGTDYRFFHFNFVIAVPLIYLMLRRKEASSDGEDQRSAEP